MEEKKENAPENFLSRYGHILFLAGLVMYLILLSIGFIAEVFDIEPVLNWWIWSPPGRG